MNAGWSDDTRLRRTVGQGSSLEGSVGGLVPIRSWILELLPLIWGGRIAALQYRGQQEEHPGSDLFFLLFTACDRSHLAQLQNGEI